MLFEKETEQIIGCAMEVHNILGCGLLEKPYENALTVEFTQRKIPFQHQARYDVIYKTIKVGEYIPDLIAFGQVIVEVKAIDVITDIEKAQVINYLKLTGLRVGLILNFKNKRLQWERLVL